MKRSNEHHKVDRGLAGRAAVAAAARQFVENLEQRVMLSTVTLNTSQTYQTLKGFGGDYAEGYFSSTVQDSVGQYTLQNLAPTQVRVPLLLQDWAPSAGTYSDTGEVTQVFQLMQQAQAEGAQIVASIWSAPNWMVSNPGVTTQLTIAPSMYNAASAAIAAWLQQAKSVYGVAVSDVSFNEPDEGNDVLFSSAALDSFIKTAGPVFQTDGLSTKWMVGDTSQVDGSAAYIAPILADPAALPYINAIAVHAWYADQAPTSQFTAIANLGTEYNLPIWSTETNFGPQNIGNFSSWTTADQIAQVYLQMLNLADASTVDYWEYQNDQPLVGAFGTPFPSYYVVQQFSAYMGSGFQVVQSASNDGNIQTVAAQNGSNFTVEALNGNSAETSTTFSGLPNGTYNLITTDASENAVASGPIMVTNGSLTVTLPAGSFNTLTTLPPIDTTPAPTAGAGTGLTGVYFDDRTMSTGAYSHLVNPAYSEVDPAINFNWGDVAPASSLTNGYFSASWTGSVEAQYSQTYTFVTVGDSGVRLWVNGQELVNDWTNNSGDTNQGTIALTAGTQYSITLQYYDNGYGDLALGWESPSTPLQIIPSTQLYPNPPTGSGTGLLGQYFVNPGGSANEPPATFATSTPAVTRVDPVVDFNWGGTSPDPSIPTNYYEAQWTGTIVPQYSETYTFVTTSDDGDNLWINGTNILSNWNLQSSATTVTSTAVSLVAGQPYNIVLQYFQNTGGAAIDLQWESPSTPLQDVPTSQLYPAAGSPPATPTVSVTETTSPAAYSLVSGQENPGVYQFTRSGSNLSQPLTVNYTMGGTAISGTQYIPLTGTVTFATGYSTATVDLVPEGTVSPGTISTATLTLSASANYTIGTGSATVSIDEPPVAPALTAAPGAGQVTLSWPTVAGATSYNVYRSTTPGDEGDSPYVSGISTNSYIDPVVTAGTTYYYTVTALNGGSEGAPSIEQNATPTAAINNGGGILSDSDIGAPNVPGAASYANGVYTVSGSGADIYNAWDEFNFADTAVAGAATVVTQVTSQTDSSPWAKAGLMFRDSSNPGAANFAVFVTPDNGITVQWRSTDVGSTTENSLLGGTGTVVPAWLKITYSGNVFTAYYSVQNVSNVANVTWTQVGSPQTLAMASALVGLAVTSHSDNILSTATFANFTITGPGQNTGSPPSAPAALEATAGNGAVNLIWPSVAGASTYTVFRGTASGQENTTLATGITGSTYTDTTAGNGTPYYYVVEAGNGVGNSTPSPEAHATPSANAAWTGSLADADIGYPGLSGSASIAGGVYTVTGSGADIWGTYDEFNFDSTPVTGNTILITEVTGQTVSDPWAKAGLMFRDSTNPGAANIAVLATPGNGVTLQTRLADGSASTYTNVQTGNVLPVWLALVDVGNVFTAYYSTQNISNPANVTWNQIGSTQSIAMSSTVAGLAVSSHNNSSRSTATFANFSLNGSAGAAGIPSAPATLTATATAGTGQIALAWSTVPGATSYDLYRSLTSGNEGTVATYTGISATNYTDTTVTSGTPYYYTVTAVEGSVQSTQSTQASATAIAVAGPATLTATTAVDSISLSWATVPGATGYSIYRGTSPAGESGTPILSGYSSTTYSDSTVTPGTTYYYFVTATVSTGTTANSPEANAAAIPSSPATLTTTAGAGQIVLSWAAVSGATSYDIYRALTPGGEGTVATYTSVSATSDTDTTVTSGTPYYYTVTAIEGISQSGPSTEATATATAVAGPATLTAATAVDAISLSWATVPGATGYSIYRGTSPAGESATPILSGYSSTTYSDSTVTPGTTYYYLVTATVASGATSASPEAFAAATPAAPTAFTATGGITQIVLSWLAVPGATSYDIYRSLTPGGEGTLASYTVSTAGYTDTAVTVSTPYYYTVTAIEGASQSGPSTEATATAAASAGPTTFTAFATTDAISLSWATVANATGYSIYRGASPGGESGTPIVSGYSSTTYSDSTVTPGTTYYYTVTASLPSGPSAPSPEAFAAALPATPATLTATAGAGQVALSWATVAGATSYDIYRAVTPGGEGTLASYTGISATSYTDTAVTVSTPYFYTVTAVETGVQSTQSAEATATPTAVAGPATLTATPATDSIALSWATVPGATGYSIYRGTSPGGESGIPLISGYSTTTYSDSTVTPGTTYYYTVTAAVASGPTLASPEAFAAALPATPATLTATAGAGQVVLSWATVAGATSYDIYRALTPGGEGTLASYTGISATSYTDTAVTISTPYYYTVTAVETGVQSTQSAEATTTPTAFAGPATLAATPATDSISLSWATVPGATGYSIYRGTSPAGENASPLISGYSTTTYSDSSVTPGTTYYYTVTATVASGATSASPEAFAAALPASPATLTAAAGVGQIVLSWFTVPGATSYDIYRSTTSGAEGTLASYTGISTTGYTDTAVTVSTPYYYTVTAVENGVQSAQSTEATAAAIAPASPVTLTAAAGVEQIVLSWSAVPGATSYDIYRSTTSGAEGTLASYTGISTTGYTDTAVTVSTPYYYTVTAVENGVQSAQSTEATATANAPASPATLTTTGGVEQIVLSWSAVPGATSYDIYRSTSSGAEGTIASYTGLSTTGYTDTAVTVSTPYYYTVTAIEGGVQTAQSTQATATATAPANPATLTATAGIGQVVLSWAAVAGATSYDIYRSTTSGVEGTIASYTGISTTGYTDTAVTGSTPYYYTVTAVENGVQSAQSTQATAAATTPATPATLTATAGTSQIVLSWSAVAGATSYDIYRSTSSGSEGTLASYTGISTAGYTDTAVTTSTPYYYTVTAVENGVQSAQSTQATATVTAPSTGALTDADIGGPSIAGSGSYSNGVYTVSGAGSDIYGNSDQFNFDYEAVSASNVTLITQVDSQTNTSSWAKAGLMFRDSTAAGGAEFSVVATPGNGVELNWRLNDGSATTYTTVLGPATVVPCWLEIVRVGNVFAAYYSTQATTVAANVTWTLIGAPQTINMTSALAGLAVTAHNTATLSTATFGNFALATATVNTTSNPTLADANIGSPSLAGTSSYSGGVYTVSGAGSDIYGTSDQFNFDYTTVTSTTASAVVQVDSQTNTSSWAKAGLMFRDTTAAGGEEFSIVATPGNGVELNWRLNDGSATTYTTVLGPAAVVPCWLEIVRVGNVFTGYYSTQSTTTAANVTWTQIGSPQTIAMPTSSLLGLAVTAHNTATLSSATFGNFSISSTGAAASAPAGPATLTATPATNSINLSWATVTGATGYSIYRGTSAGGESTTPLVSGYTGTTYSDATVTPGLTYYYTITATVSSATSSASPEAHAAALPSAPATLSATSGIGQIVLSWSAVNGATSYDIYRSTTFGAEGTIASYTGISTTGYTDTAVTVSTPYYYTVTAVENGVQSAQSTQATATATAPVVPTPATLTATAGIGQIVLSWSAVPGATSYDIYRSTTSGVEGTLASYTGISTTGYTDTAVTVSTPYYYTVTAVESGVQSAQSTQATATATAPSGGALTDVNIGSPGVAGTASYANGIYTVSGGGADIYGTADQFNFDYQAVSATNVTLVTQVDSQTNTNSWAKAGLMFRDSTAAGGAEFAVVATPGNGVEVQWRLADNSATTYTTALSGNVVPCWLEIVRVGNVFTAYYSTQATTVAANVNWTIVGTSESIPMATAYAGLAVTAHNNATASTATFANFALTTATVTTVSNPTLTDTDIGSPGLAGSASEANNVYTVSGGGADIYGAADQFNYDYTTVSGNTTAVVQVNSQTNSNSWAKAGLMFRDSTAAGGAEFSVFATPGNGVEVQWRNADGSVTTYTTALSGNVVPCWLEIVRIGNVFTAYYSTQTTVTAGNVTWTAIGSPETISMSTTALAGLAVTAHNNASLSTATFSNLTL